MDINNTLEYLCLCLVYYAIITLSLMLKQISRTLAVGLVPFIVMVLKLM